MSKAALSSALHGYAIVEEPQAIGRITIRVIA
jgi:hypothetical protein